MVSGRTVPQSPEYNDRQATLHLASRLAYSAIGILLVWSRFGPLAHGFWHDEVITIMHFVNGGPAAILFGDYTPNNHIFFSFSAWLIISSIGMDETAYRLASVIPAIMSVILIAAWLHGRFGTSEGLTALTILTISPLHLELSSQARGYGLTYLAAAVMLIAADNILTRRGGRDMPYLFIAGTVGTVTLPIFAIPFTLTVLSLAYEPTRRRSMAFGLGTSALVCLLIYAPSLSALAQSTRQEFGETLQWHGAITASYRHLLHPVWQDLIEHSRGGHTLSTTSKFLIGLIFTYSLYALGMAKLYRHGQIALGSALMLPVFGTYLALTIAQVFLADRFVSFLLVPAVALLSISIGECVRMAKVRGSLEALTTGVLLLLAFSMLVAFTERAKQVVDVPREAFEGAGRFVNGSDVDSIVTNSVRPDGLEYYIDRPVHILTRDDWTAKVCRSVGPTIFIDHPYRNASPDTSCLVDRGSSQVVIPQRTRGGSVRVWVIPPRLEGDES